MPNGYLCIHMLKLEGIYKLLRSQNLSAWEPKKSTSFSPLFLLVWSCFFFPMLGIEREVDLSFFNFLIIDSLFPLCFFIMLISFGFFISGYLFLISSSISITIWKKKKFTIRGFFLLEGEQKKGALTFLSLEAIS